MRQLQQEIFDIRSVCVFNLAPSSVETQSGLESRIKRIFHALGFEKELTVFDRAMRVRGSSSLVRVVFTDARAVDVIVTSNAFLPSTWTSVEGGAQIISKMDQLKSDFAKHLTATRARRSPPFGGYLSCGRWSLLKSVTQGDSGGKPPRAAAAAADDRW